MKRVAVVVVVVVVDAAAASAAAAWTGKDGEQLIICREIAATTTLDTRAVVRTSVQ